MNMNIVEEFLKELNDLQDKYGIYIGAEYIEDLEYSFDGEGEHEYIVGVDSYVVFMDKDGYEIQGIYMDENSHYYLMH